MLEMITRHCGKGSLDISSLQIERAGKMVRQHCCRSPMHKCGDHCPMFLGPLREADLSGEVCRVLSIPRGSTVIQICEATLVFQEFEDNRSKENE